ncbi:hypothetical protein BCR34DRAFT_391524 [Clohesyomyces aquaticus]|uniref:Uncharacterized protein n=1 Tax=Clohesyomyces aquaticus TaxID=1231657 RepID=A0A1Y1ZEK0_9PLEO|nr:hypothetical protein BCR34DRAFT_391524 [Clohesyomyces aquaticus]
MFVAKDLATKIPPCHDGQDELSLQRFTDSWIYSTDKSVDTCPHIDASRLDVESSFITRHLILQIRYTQFIQRMNSLLPAVCDRRKHSTTSDSQHFLNFINRERFDSILNLEAHKVSSPIYTYVRKLNSIRAKARHRRQPSGSGYRGFVGFRIGKGISRSAYSLYVPTRRPLT